jgi:hypothetical protein
MNVICGNFRVDHILDHRIRTAVSFLTSHRCYTAARTVAASLVAISELASLSCCAPMQTARLRVWLYLDSREATMKLLSY